MFWVTLTQKHEISHRNAYTFIQKYEISQRNAL